MASKKAKLWLLSQGIKLSHNGTEKSNFATGSGHGLFSMPFHIVKLDSRYGSSESTVGWAGTLDDARKQRDALNDATRGIGDTGRGGSEYCANRTVNHYIRDVRTDETVS